jgi:peptide subunit release factor 1 (eRF1)
VVDNQAIDRLRRYRPTNAPVLSVYLAVPSDPNDFRLAESYIHSLLKPVRELSDSDELGHYERLSLRDDVAKVLALGVRVQTLQGKTLGVFSCSRAGLYEEVLLERRVRERAVVDSTPYLRPALGVLDEIHRYCTVIVDRERGWIHSFEAGELKDATDRPARAPRKRDFAGWHGLQEYGVRNHADELARRHYRQTAEAVEQFIQRTGAELLLVGGHEEALPEFLPFLTQDLQRKLVGTFILDPRTATPARIRDEAAQVVELYERREESDLVAQALDRVAAGGLAAAGLEWCLLAVNEKGVQLLLIHNDVAVAGRACETCGWLGIDTGSETCPIDGSRTRLSSDIIDEMSGAVIDAGGRVEHVYAPTELSLHLVAGFLRFPVAAPPTFTGT